MANAIRKISIEEGYDPASHALVAFGGAGGQHACGVAGFWGWTGCFYRQILDAQCLWSLPCPD